MNKYFEKKYMEAANQNIKNIYILQFQQIIKKNGFSRK